MNIVDICNEKSIRFMDISFFSEMIFYWIIFHIFTTKILVLSAPKWLRDR